MKDKVAIVTGATSGIGAAAARMFGRAGARVLVVGRREAEGAQTVSEIEASGGTAAFCRADMTVANDIDAMVDAALNRWGRLDYAFNNAGLFSASPAFHEFDDALWADWMAVNLDGVFRCMRAEIRAMLETLAQTGEGAAIVNNASIMGHRGSTYAGAAYAASKHGVIGLTRQAAIEYAKLGIRVNAVSPGPTLTPITAATAALPEAARRKVIDDLLPIGRMGAPDEVAATVLFLCSDAAAMITGHDIAVDGGQLARL
ncbi:MAG: SDR family NAD(P)-dependent oxidoreductase [Alphaproteobacteria bacterium]